MNPNLELVETSWYRIPVVGSSIISGIKKTGTEEENTWIREELNPNRGPTLFSTAAASAEFIPYKSICGVFKAKLQNDLFD